MWKFFFFIMLTNVKNTDNIAICSEDATYENGIFAFFIIWIHILNKEVAYDNK